jgi:hypothetical protein
LKRCLLLILILALCAWASARTFPVKVYSADLKLAGNYLESIGAEIDFAGPGYLNVFVDGEQYRQLRDSRFESELLPDPGVFLDRLQAETRTSNNPMRDYYTYDELATALQGYAAQYPSLCHLESIGQTVEGREQWFLEITDNPAVEEAETELKLTSTIHGDEQVGCYCLMQLIEYILSNYAIDDRVADMVNNTELWIMPMTNPDGVAHNQRENANGQDLNRNFPDFIDDPVNTPDGREIEVRNIMNFTAAHTPTFSFNLHSGALVINYPYDTQYALCPDNDLYIHMALTYSQYNGPMYGNFEFPQGITNGAAWYLVHGGMQDWNYFFMKDFDLTGELGDDYSPDPDLLPEYWDNNRESMLHYIELWKTSVNGIVSDPDGNPLAATVRVVQGGEIVNTDPNLGDYHRLLLPGTYSLSFGKWGYQTQTIDTVVVVDGTPTMLDVTLTPVGTLTVSGVVRDDTENPVADAVVTMTDSALDPVTTSPDGAFAFENVPAGTHHILITKPGYAPFDKDLNIDETHSVLAPHLHTPVFYDGFETGLDLWNAQTPWGLDNVAGSSWLADSPDGDYDNDENKWVKLVSPLDLTGFTYANLYFNLTYSLESDYDYLYIETSSDNTHWSQLDVVTGAWDNRLFKYDLEDYLDGVLYLRFRITSDESTTQDGVLIDNVTIAAGVPESVSDPNGAQPRPLVGMSFPNPLRIGSGSASIQCSIPAGIRRGRFEVFNIRGQSVYDETVTPDRNLVSWNGCDRDGRLCAPGVYLYRIDVGPTRSPARKLLLIH